MSKSISRPASKPTVLIPTLNEEQTIGATIADVRKYVPDCHIVVVDSSSDKTADIASKMGATIIGVPKRGKGRAVRDALNIIPAIFPKPHSDFYIMLDGDSTYPAEHIPDMLTLLQNTADVVMGYRRWLDPGSITFLNGIGNAGLSLLASILYFRWVEDLCTGLWGFRKEALDKFRLTSDGFTLEADLFTNAALTKCRIAQMPIHYRARPDGSKTKLSVFDGFRIAAFVIRKRFGW